jgi:hypothetical protein
VQLRLLRQRVVMAAQKAQADVIKKLTKETELFLDLSDPASP